MGIHPVPPHPAHVQFRVPFPMREVPGFLANVEPWVWVRLGQAVSDAVRNGSGPAARRVSPGTGEAGEEKKNRTITLVMCN